MTEEKLHEIFYLFVSYKVLYIHAKYNNKSNIPC